MKAKLKTFIFGLVIGVLISFPLGINFGRGAALFSNPFAERDVQQKLGEKMKEGTEKMLEDAKEKIHEVTKPAE
jgi:gas vesicle protein